MMRQIDSLPDSNIVWGVVPLADQLIRVMVVRQIGEDMFGNGL